MDDIMIFWKKIIIERIDIDHKEMSCTVNAINSLDTELTFNVNLPLDHIMEIIREQQDSHVMLQTVQPIEKYTGERNYSII